MAMHIRSFEKKKGEKPYVMVEDGGGGEKC